MVKFLFEQNIIMYVFAGLCGLGLLVRLIVNLVFKTLVKASENPAETKNKLLKLMKMRFEACYKAKIGVNNVDTFVDKNVLRYRFCGVLLSTWDNFSGQILFLNLLIVPISAVFGVVFKCGQDLVLLTGAVGILTSAVLIIVDKSINLPAKKRMLHVNLLDYLENFCKVRLEQEAFHPELYEQMRREYAQVAESKKQVVTSKEAAKENAEEELDRRREAKMKKEEEKKLQAQRREEERRRLEEIRKEEERRKQEERKQLAAKRREEELRKIEEERKALEARQAELKKLSMEKLAEKLPEPAAEKETILHSLEEDLRPSQERTDLNKVLQGLDEIAASKERDQKEKKQLGKDMLSMDKQAIDKPSTDKLSMDKLSAEEKKAAAKASVQNVKPAKGSSKTRNNSNSQEDKVIEDVLKEFFA
jgi:hypothetical protein